MKVTQVAIRPTESSLEHNRPSLTPELLAASGARYSRNNEGLDAILSKIDPDNIDKSVDSIFRMIDYGHQSIADMVPVAMFLDGISIFLAYYIWSVCPTASGQESSTRYIKLSVDELISPEDLGIPEADIERWRSAMSESFEAYSKAVEFWEEVARQNAEVARIPLSLINDPSEKAQKQVARMKRNYAFDRSRYFLPVAAATNMMLIMSARGWVQLCQLLLSHPLSETRRVGQAIRDELELVAPRMLKHAQTKEYIQRGLRQEFDSVRRFAKDNASMYLREDADTVEHPVLPSLEIVLPEGTTEADLVDGLAFYENRYAWIGSHVQRTMVRFAWEAVSMAEMRDLNRHRTGTKYAPLSPRGFYCAIDQLQTAKISNEMDKQYKILAQVGQRASATAWTCLCDDDPTYIYWSLLGTQYRFEHLTSADKFVYEAELRTGTGAHFRYAEHLRDVVNILRAKVPNFANVIRLGTSEPE